jgi:ribosomal protein S18 acetylase RimI-like enzyme
MSASSALISVKESDELFLIELYASTRAVEMANAPWSAEQKQAFLKMQFDAQNSYYRERYPNASFEVIQLNDRSVGRLYQAELADEIRIIDLAFLPEHFDEGVFTELLTEILQKGERIGKKVQIYLEDSDPAIQIFINLGFQKIDVHGIYFLWQRLPAVVKTENKASALSA